MSHAWLALGLALAVLVALAVPLGRYVARVFLGQARWAQRVLGPVERAWYRAAGVRADDEMTWKAYAASVLGLGAASVLLVYALARLQGALGQSAAALPGVSPHVAFNTAVSFATNTNWQAYSGETTMSQLTQMLALAVQGFVSAATGMAVLVALIRGLVRRSASTLGSFWVDVTRAMLYVLLPLSLVLAVALTSQGVVQTFEGSARVTLADPVGEGGAAVREQVLPLGPVASQVAIKQLGTNGGGFFNANSAHPFENPTPITNFLELIAILLVPAALCFAFGAMVGDRRQGWAVFAAMAVIFVPLAVATMSLEQAGGPSSLDVDRAAAAWSSGGNLEGKEVRIGAAGSALWAVATTATSSGSVNAMHDSFTPLGGLAPMWLMQLGEVVFGGVGSGLYGMLVYALLAVFLAGLMVGRTPEYLGKKIEAYELKMAALVLLLPTAAALVGTAVASGVPAGTAPLGNGGAHGFSEILYAFSSGANNNGSAFAGLTADGAFYTFAIALCMLVGRYWVIVPVLAIAGALARKGPVPKSAGTLPTHTPMFVGLVVCTVLLVGALSFLPALALGPVAEHLGAVAPR